VNEAVSLLSRERLRLSEVWASALNERYRLIRSGKKGVTRDFGTPAMSIPNHVLCLARLPLSFCSFQSKNNTQETNNEFPIASSYVSFACSFFLVQNQRDRSKSHTRSRLFRPFRGLSPLRRGLVGTSIRL